MRTALVAGSTGLVGKHLIRHLLDSNRYTAVKSIARSDLDIVDEKLVQLKLDFDRLPQYTDELKADDVFCCLGTTMAKAKSQEQFYKVDYTYPTTLATRCQLLGAEKFFLVSALGADKHSSFYYNRVKGELEDTISSVPFRTIHIFRPSLLLGKREETRQGEDAAKFFYKFFSFLIPARFKGIDAEKIARSMIVFASENDPGIFIHESRDLQSY